MDTTSVPEAAPPLAMPTADDNTLRMLFVGDLVGEAAVSFVCEYIPRLRLSHGLHFVVVNGENMHQGRGFNEGMCQRLLTSGVDVLTGGDHSFDKHLIFPLMRDEPRLLRPHNYPPGAPGRGFGVFPCSDRGCNIGVLNLRGLQFFQNPIDSPFRGADDALRELHQETHLVFVDFHAEATAEKWAMGWYLDGRVSAMAGTHTHVATADEQILPQGTGYITDVGFTGPHRSVIGMDVETALRRFRFQTPQKYEEAKGHLQLNGVIFELDIQSGQCLHVERLRVKSKR